MNVVIIFSSGIPAHNPAMIALIMIASKTFMRNMHKVQSTRTDMITGLKIISTILKQPFLRIF